MWEFFADTPFSNEIYYSTQNKSNFFATSIFLQSLLSSLYVSYFFFIRFELYSQIFFILCVQFGIADVNNKITTRIDFQRLLIYAWIFYLNSQITWNILCIENAFKSNRIAFNQMNFSFRYKRISFRQLL